MADEKPKSFSELMEAAKASQPQAVPQLAGIVDMARAKMWFDQHWKDPVVCPVCKDTRWTIAPYFVVHHTSSTPTPLAPVYPFVQVACNTCFYTMLFNAVPMGLWAPWAPNNG